MLLLASTALCFYSASAQELQPTPIPIPGAPIPGGPNLAPLRPAPLLPPLPATPAPVTAPTLTGPLTTLPPGIPVPSVLPPIVPNARPELPLTGRPTAPPERLVGTGQGYLIDGWQIVPSIDLRQSLTDNSLEVNSPRRTDTITTFAPSLTVSREGANNQIYLNYNLQGDVYWRDSDLTRVQHNLTEFSHTGLIRDWLYFDTDATIRQQPLQPFSGLTTNSAAQNINNAQEIGFAASPYLRHRFGTFAESELRYAYGQVNYDTAGLVDTQNHQILWNTVSGDEFTRLKWTTQLGYTNSTRSGTLLFIGGPTQQFIANPNGDATTAVGQVNFEYAITRQISALWGGGYESIEDPTLAHNIHDAIWNIGFHLRPGPRTDLRVLYGRQYGATWWSGAGQYELSPATKLTAQLINDIETSSNLVQQNLLGLDVDEYGNAVVGPDRRLFDLNDALLGISQAAFHRRRAELELRTEFGRNRLDPMVYYERRITDITGSVSEAQGVRLLYTRDLNPDLVGTASVAYQHTNFSGPSARESDWYGSLGVIYSLSTRTGLYGTYSHLTRNSTIQSGDLEENLFVIGVRRYF
jgi:uncharacterized protein (PEP-CTERM system associated)